MSAILALGVLGATVAFFLFVLVQFWREAASPRREGGRHLKVMPFCMACAQGWPHALKMGAEELPAARLQSQVLEMPSPAENRTRERAVPRDQKQPVTRGAA
jgi:hypothetical protein